MLGRLAWSEPQPGETNDPELPAHVGIRRAASPAHNVVPRSARQFEQDQSQDSACFEKKPQQRERESHQTSGLSCSTPMNCRGCGAGSLTGTSSPSLPVMSAVASKRDSEELMTPSALKPVGDAIDGEIEEARNEDVGLTDNRGLLSECRVRQETCPCAHRRRRSYSASP